MPRVIFLSLHWFVHRQVVKVVSPLKRQRSTVAEHEEEEEEN